MNIEHDQKLGNTEACTLQNYCLWSFVMFFITEHDSESIPEQAVGKQETKEFFLHCNWNKETLESISSAFLPCGIFFQVSFFFNHSS